VHKLGHKPLELHSSQLAEHKQEHSSQELHSLLLVEHKLAHMERHSLQP